MAKVIPIYMKGDKSLASNYRPTSLLSLYTSLLNLYISLIWGAAPRKQPHNNHIGRFVHYADQINRTKFGIDQFSRLGAGEV